MIGVRESVRVLFCVVVSCRVFCCVVEETSGRTNVVTLSQYLPMLRTNGQAVCGKGGNRRTPQSGTPHLDLVRRAAKRSTLMENIRLYSSSFDIATAHHYFIINAIFTCLYFHSRIDYMFSFIFIILGFNSRIFPLLPIVPLYMTY